MAVSEHRSLAPDAGSIRVAVISVSDSRTLENDEGGALIQALAGQAGFAAAGRELLRDEPDIVQARVRSLVAAGAVDVILLTGGTGVAPRDGTIEAVAPLFERRLDGFGELFRMLSFAEIGSAAMLSRACAGIAGGVAIFALPGSPAGVRLALERLILPELGHLVGQLRRQPHGNMSADPAEKSADTASTTPHHHHHDAHHHRP